MHKTTTRKTLSSVLVYPHYILIIREMCDLVKTIQANYLYY